jgi:hypothetical protein
MGILVLARQAVMEASETIPTNCALDLLEGSLLTNQNPQCLAVEGEICLKLPNRERRDRCRIVHNLSHEYGSSFKQEGINAIPPHGGNCGSAIKR